MTYELPTSLSRYGASSKPRSATISADVRAPGCAPSVHCGSGSQPLLSPDYSRRFVSCSRSIPAAHRWSPLLMRASPVLRVQSSATRLTADATLRARHGSRSPGPAAT